MARRTWWRAALNLPEEGLTWRTKPPRTAGGKDSVTSWEQAADKPPTPDQPESVHVESTWAAVHEPKSVRGVAFSLRLVALVLLVLLAWIGVMSIIRTAHPAAAGETSIDPALTADTAAAAQFAAAFSVDYLTWDETKLDDHAKRIAVYWADAGQGGWNGKGTQTARTPVVMNTDPVDAHHVSVTVSVTITSTGHPAQSMALKVPVLIQAGRVSVAGPPTVVGVPDPVPTEQESTPITDQSLTQTTRAMAEAFFTAYAQGNVGADAAPGSTIPAPTMHGSATVGAWSVYDGGDEQRDAVANVTWTLDSGGQLLCVYRVVITTVSSGNQTRWQIAEIY